MLNNSILPPDCAYATDGASTTPQRKRLGYIDAMRGTSMILVVLEHVLLMMGIPTTTTPLGAVLSTFRMPLFFFVSGFFAYKLSSKWNVNFTKLVLKKKIQAQIIGTIFFYSLFHLCFHNDIFEWIDNGFGWFWFTIVLFQMFLIYLAFSIIEKTIGNKMIVNISLPVLSIVLFIIHVKGTNVDFKLWNVLSWFNLCYYFQFYAFGIFAKKYNHIFLRIITSKYFKAIAIVSFIVLLLLSFGMNGLVRNYNRQIANIIEALFVRYAGLIVIFIFFYTYRNWFEHETPIVSSLKYIGKRTLDIYMLHMFFVPEMRWMGSYFLHGTNLIIIQLIATLSISICVVGVCLLTSLLFRSSSVLEEWLFGVSESGNISSKSLK